MSTEQEATPVKLGEQYTDKITGFTGTATARYEFLYGCVRVLLEGTGKEGDKPVEFTFDEQRLVHTYTNTRPKPTATSGGPQSEPPSRDPSR